MDNTGQTNCFVEIVSSSRLELELIYVKFVFVVVFVHYKCHSF